MQKAKKTRRQFVKAGKKATILLDFVDEALDQMALFVKMLVIVALLLAVSSRWDNGLHPLIEQEVKQFIKAVRFVGNEAFKV